MLALLFALVAAAAILSESAPIKAIPNADEAFLESMLDSLKPSAPQLTEDLQVGNVYGSVNIVKITVGAQDAGCTAQNNPEATGNPVPASGAGMLVAAGKDQFVLHDHVGNLAARIPDPNRAFATYKFASSVKVTKVVIVQHGNGIDEIELFSGTTSCGKSQGKAPNGQVTGPGVGLQESVAYDYTGFSSTCPPNKDFKIIIRTITCTCGYATYRMIPMAVPARTEDVGNRHEEVHGAGGIVDLLDKMLSKVVGSVASTSTKKTDADDALAKQKIAFDAAKSAAVVATDEFIASNLQAEKEKAMIGQIRAMVISLNKGQFVDFATCKDMKAANKDAKSGVYDFSANGKSYKAYCDMDTAGGGWTLAMRTQEGGDAFNYEATHWTSDTVVNDADFASGDFGNSQAKFAAFNVMPVSEMLIKSKATGRFSQLGLPRVTTLLDLFKSGTTNLNVISGDSTPQKVMSGGASSVCGVAWRSNAKSASFNDFKVRIGGFFTHQWDCSYGSDSNGQPTGAEQAGIGLWNHRWGPERTSGRDAGTCQAHNYNNAPGGGQQTVAVTLWVR